MMPDPTHGKPDAPASEPVTAGGRDHTVRFHMHDGYMEWKMRCPFDLGDTTRPCWPHEEDNTPSTVGDCCTYVSWFENCDVLDVVREATPVEWIVSAEWDFFEPSFCLAAARPVPTPSEGPETDV